MGRRGREEEEGWALSGTRQTGIAVVRRASARYSGWANITGLTLRTLLANRLRHVHGMAQNYRRNVAQHPLPRKKAVVRSRHEMLFTAVVAATKQRHKMHRKQIFLNLKKVLVVDLISFAIVRLFPKMKPDFL